MTQVPDRAEVVVVGGGVMGTSVAFHLAEAGVDVVLLERGSLGQGSTCKAAGGVRANFSDPLNIALGARSLACFADFHQRPGQQIDLHRTGYLFALTTQDQVRAFEQAVELQRSMGLRAELVDVDRAVELSPYLNPDGVLAAAWSPDDGHCTPESVVLGFASGARRHGARICTGVDVIGIDLLGSQIVGVRTSAGGIQTGTVVICAGAWSPQVAAYVGVELPVEPVRRQLVVTEPMTDPLPTAFTIDYGSTFYWHREGPGMLMGFSDPDVTPSFDLTADPNFDLKLAELAMHRAPALVELGVQTGWSGLYEVTPDHNALLGETANISRLLYATGFSGHGFLQGPAVGEILRDLVLEVPPFVDVSALSVDRFSRGELRPERNIV